MSRLSLRRPRPRHPRPRHPRPLHPRPRHPRPGYPALRRHGWRPVYAAFGFIGSGLVPIILPLIVVAAGHRPFRIGAIVAAQSVGTLASPFWGWLTDRSGSPRLAVSGGFLLLALGLAMLASVVRLEPLLLASFILGVGGGSCATACVLRAASDGGEHPAVGISHFQMLASAGGMIGMSAAGLLPAHVAVLLGCGVAGLAALGTGWLARAKLGVAHRTSSPGRWRPVKGRAPFLRFLIAWALFCLAVSTFSSQYPILMRRGFGISFLRSSTMLAIATLLSLPLYGASRVLVGRFGCGACLRGGFVVRSLCLAGFGILALARVHAMAALGFAALFQFVWPIIAVSGTGTALLLSTSLPGVRIGTLGAAAAISSMLGSLLSGVIADSIGYRFIAVAAALLAVLPVTVPLDIPEAPVCLPSVPSEASGPDQD